MNNDAIPWNYTTDPIGSLGPHGISAMTSFTSTPHHIDESHTSTQPSPGITTPKQSSQNKYYFKIKPYTGKYLYHGPLYLHDDGTYRSNNSREANMMYQKGLLDTKTTNDPILWNAPFATLPVITPQSDLTNKMPPIDKFYRLIIIQPNPEKKYTHSVSYNYLRSGKILYFRWNNSDRTGGFVSGGSIASGILEPISETTWINDQTKRNCQPAFNLAYCKLVDQRNLAKHVNKLIKKRKRRSQLKALVKSIYNWKIRNINTINTGNIKTEHIPLIIRPIYFFGPGANNIRYRIVGFL